MNTTYIHTTGKKLPVMIYRLTQSYRI